MMARHLGVCLLLLGSLACAASSSVDTVHIIFSCHLGERSPPRITDSDGPWLDLPVRPAFHPITAARRQCDLPFEQSQPGAQHTAARGRLLEGAPATHSSWSARPPAPTGRRPEDRRPHVVHPPARPARADPAAPPVRLPNTQRNSHS